MLRGDPRILEGFGSFDIRYVVGLLNITIKYYEVQRAERWCFNNGWLARMRWNTGPHTGGGQGLGREPTVPNLPTNDERLPSLKDVSITHF